MTCLALSMGLEDTEGFERERCEISHITKTNPFRKDQVFGNRTALSTKTERRGFQMIITTNRYVVQAAYAAQNQEHIRRVMEELRALRRTDLKYSVFVEDDGKTFIHLRFCANEEASKVFDTLESFQAFQAALLASHPEVPPTKAIHLTLVGSTSDLL